MRAIFHSSYSLKITGLKTRDFLEPEPDINTQSP